MEFEKQTVVVYKGSLINGQLLKKIQKKLIVRGCKNLMRFAAIVAVRFQVSVRKTCCLVLYLYLTVLLIKRVFGQVQFAGGRKDTAWCPGDPSI